MNLIGVDVDSNEIHLEGLQMSINLAPGSPDLVHLNCPPCDASSKLRILQGLFQLRRGANLTHKVRTFRHKRPPQVTDTITGSVQSNDEIVAREDTRHQSVKVPRIWLMKSFLVNTMISF